MMPFTVNLIGPSPWGFRISGGRDFKKAITVSKVNAGSKAETACLQPGDIIIEINGLSAGEMLNVEAQNKIKCCTTQLQLLVERPAPPTPGQTNGITEQLVGRFQEAVQVSRDENQNYKEYTISSPASLSPGPYTPEPPSSPDRRGGRITPTNKSLQFHSWSSEEKNVQSHRLSRPLSQVQTISEHLYKKKMTDLKPPFYFEIENQDVMAQ
ncbi:PDZ and LIM domain protein 2-like [Danio aesculapii]|uniref:PDZ and LIM domain protein 2-like n=1 Tax=Danio aesculapii TaxID=1142201 RepID=UPI0024C0858C|nr:PDZ and LIM domain protein 2-like [Danio aesculapii]